MCVSEKQQVCHTRRVLWSIAVNDTDTLIYNDAGKVSGPRHFRSIELSQLKSFKLANKQRSSMILHHLKRLWRCVLLCITFFTGKARAVYCSQIFVFI